MTVRLLSELRHRLVLEEPQRTPDGAGGYSVSWVGVATIWGAIRPAAGGEQVTGGRLSGQVSHEITIRHRDGVLPTMRFSFENRIFDILAVLNFQERGCWLRCLCRERDL